MTTHRAQTAGWVSDLCHCGGSIFPNHFRSGTPDLREAHKTRCCNCVDSYVSLSDGAANQSWYCRECGEAARG